MAELKARVRMDTTTAIKSLQKLQNQINNLNNATAKVSAGVNKISTANTQATKTARGLTTQYRSANTAARNLWTTMKRVAALYIAGQAGGSFFTAADNMTSAQNKLNAVNATNMGDSGKGGYDSATLRATEQDMNKIYEAAQRARVGFSDMMTNVAKSITLAGDAFNNEMDNAIRFQEIMGKAYAIAGASQAEMSSSMYQLVQALGSGILQGEELRSVREGAPLAYKAIEKFAQGVYNTTESLKDLGSQGKITSDIVVAAILGMGDDVDTAFGNTITTFAQAMTMISNVIQNELRPAFAEMTAILNSEQGAAAVNGIAVAIRVVAQVVLWAATVFGIVFNWIVDNWTWLQYVFAFVATAIIGFLIAIQVQAIITFVTMNSAVLLAALPFVLIAGLIVLLIMYIVWLANTAQSAIEFITYALLAFVAVFLAIALILAIAGASPWLIWLAIAIAVIALILVVVVNFASEICGVIMWLVALIVNLVVGLALSIVEFCLLPLASAWDAFANFLGNLFNDPLAAIASLFVDLLNFVLGILRSIAGAIDSIFGTSLASGIDKWMSGLSDWAASVGNGTYEQKSKVTEAIQASVTGLRSGLHMDMTDAYDTGAKFGQGAEDWFANIGGNLQNALKTDSSTDNSTIPALFSGGDSLTFTGGQPGNNLDLGNLTGANLGDALGTKTPKGSSGSVGGGGGGGKAGKSLDNIDANTASMADSMDLSQEDIEYLRKMANLEWKKEFTTASVTVDMKNFNTVNKDLDLDGIATRLADKLYSELDAVANGVYA